MVRIGVFLGALALAGVVFAMGFGGNSTPTVPLPDDVVIFGAENVQINIETNILGGDMATNNRAQIGRDVVFGGSLLADVAHFSQDVTILGNLEADTILGSDPTVQGEIITPRVTDDYEFPALPNIEPGRDDIRIKKGETATLQPGRYRDITIDRGASVTFEPGTYDVRRLHVGRGSVLTIEGATGIRVRNNLFIGSRTIIDLATDLTTDDLTWNLRGHGAIYIGSGTFGAGIVLAPNATIQLGEAVTWRGRLIAKRVTLGRSVQVTSRRSISPLLDPDAVVEDEKDFFPGNQIGVVFVDDVTPTNVREVEDFLSGRIVGFVPNPPDYLFEVPTATVAEHDALIAALEAKAFSFVDIVYRNSLTFIQ